MANCNGNISDGILNDCDNQPIAGVKTKAWMMNINDVDKAGLVFDATNSLIIKTFLMKMGNHAFNLEVLKNSLGGDYKNVSKEFGSDYWAHTIDIKVTDYNNAVKARLKELTNAEVCVILENKGADNETKFEIYGLDSGLVLGDSGRNTNENSGVLSIMLKSDDGAEEPNVPYTIFDTDYETTLTMIEGLVA